ncbi:hypothetical protein STIV2_A110 [Sulfolobus turreted icosahedral virus 2]|uniref:Uncharacterized protein n=1 Tax=Sulfolobus turreted icosahedral virus 2 TaxID=754004 RepID=D5IEZ8_9VIRU|nr:hypothetical protein STIV2_A110 [Sulfolobus turreted icosahedral virus 2]ADF27769.1 hypothetical protein STIV2_A110 [Sulfolobus turreted icosahedral virus 2]
MKVPNNMIVSLITQIAESGLDPKAKEYLRELKEGKIQPRYEECQTVKIFLDGITKASSKFKEAAPLSGSLQFFYVLVLACETNEEFRKELVDMYNQLEDFFLAGIRDESG